MVNGCDEEPTKVSEKCQQITLVFLSISLLSTCMLNALALR